MSSSVSFLLLQISSAIMVWVSESPPNLDEPRLHVMPGFPRDGDLPKPLARIIPPLACVLPLWFSIINNNGTPLSRHGIAFGMIAAAHLWMRWTQKHCGRFYTFDRSIKSQHKLVQSGPYQYIQNPGYLSLVGTVLGVALFSNWHWSNLLPIGTAMAVLSGIPTEEKMLQEEFGKEYEEYQASRPRLIPGIY